MDEFDGLKMRNIEAQDLAEDKVGIHLGNNDWFRTMIPKISSYRLAK